VSVTWGIAGLGAMGDRFAGALRAVPGNELVAVAGRDAERARAFAERHGAAASYDDYDALLADERVQVAYIATPNVLHAPQALLALEAGKHVLVEKPMALSVSDARQMAAEARARSRVLGVGFHLRHHPVHAELVRRLGAGGAGRPLHARALWGAGGAEIPRDIWQMEPGLAGLGSLGGLGVHLVDLLNWIAGDEVTEVVAMDDGEWEDHPVEFLTSALLRFAGGCFAELTCSRRLPHAENSLVVHAERCRLDAHGTMGMEAAGWLTATRAGAEPELWRPQLEDLYQSEIRAFAAAVEEGRAFHASAEDGVRSVAVTSAIVEAARTGRAVPVEPAGSAAHAHGN
jgi:1,5-anhydro-D-fructose reductase (1,5-anhydro-D-mannitol-forming)